MKNFVLLLANIFIILNIIVISNQRSTIINLNEIIELYEANLTDLTDNYTEDLNNRIEYEKEFMKDGREFILKQLEIPYCQSLVDRMSFKNEETFNEPCNKIDKDGLNINMMTDFCLSIYDKIQNECDFDYWDYYNIYN